MRKLILIFLICSLNQISAQLDDLYFPESNESEIIEKNELFAELLENPVSLVSGNLYRLLIIPGITDFDIFKLNLIVKENKEYSKSDIIKSGFPKDKMKMISPFVILSKADQFVIDIRNENAWRDSEFYNNRLRCKIESTDFECGFVFDRDTGENMKSCFYSYYIQKRVKNFSLIIGNYRINWGSGILHAPAFSRYFSRSATNTVTRYRRIIRPHTGASESGFFKGAAFQFEKERFSSISWISKTDFDHPMKLLGTALIFKNNWINSGLLIERTTEDSTADYFPAGKYTDAFSIHTAIGKRNFLLKTEFARAAGENGAVCSMQYGKNKIQQVLVYRNYQKTFPQLYGNPISRKSSFAGENGIYYGIAWKIKPQLKLDFYSDLWNNKSEKSSLNDYSKEEMLNLNWEKQKVNIQTYIRHRGYDDKFTIADSIITAKIHLITAKLSIRYKLNNLLIRSDLNLRDEYIPDIDSNRNAFAFIQQFNWKLKMFEIWGRLTAFKAEIPLYAYENNIRGQATTVCFSDQGMRYAVKLKYKFKKYQLELKAYYQDSKTDKKGINLLLAAKFK